MTENREKLIELLDNVGVGRLEGSFIADHLIANGVVISNSETTTQRWIPVTERLPEPGVLVLVHSKLGCTYFSHRLYCHAEGKPFVIEYAGGWEVTHWMPLPHAPEAKEL